MSPIIQTPSSSVNEYELVSTQKTRESDKDKVVTEEPEVFKCVRVFTEFQFASLEIEMQNVTHTHTHTCILVLYPDLTQVHALFMHMQTNFSPPPFFIPVTSCSSVLFHLCLSSCLPPLVSICVCLSRYFFNQVEHCLGYFPAFLTSVCLLPFSSLPPLFLPSPLQSSNQCFAVRAASLSPSLPPSPLRPLPTASLTLSLRCPPPSPSLSLNKAINSTLHACFTPSLCALCFPLPQHLPRYLFVLKNWRTLPRTPLVN